MTKGQLKAYQSKKLEIAQLQSKVKEIEAALYYPKIQKRSGIQSGRQVAVKQQEDLAIHHMEMLDLYRTKANSLAKEQIAVENAIDRLDSTERILMRHRYIDGMKFEDICTAMDYSLRQVHRIHNKALLYLHDSEE